MMDIRCKAQAKEDGRWVRGYYVHYERNVEISNSACTRIDFDFIFTGHGTDRVAVKPETVELLEHA